MNNNEQVFYIQYRENDGYLTTLKDQKGYDALSDDDKKNYQQVIVDLDHLAGWGNYWDKCRYINGVLSYPDNYPKDQSATISDLKNQLSKIISNNNNTQKSNNDLQNQLSSANGKIKQLGKLSMTLQEQLSKSVANNDQSNNKIKELGGLVMQLQQQLAAKNNVSINK